MEHVIFALAQYTPDLLRQEPRNIGVFLADERRVLGRFLGEDPSGLFLPRNIPQDFFNDVDLYLDWHEHWSYQLKNIPPGESGIAFLREHIVRNAGKAFAVIAGGEYEGDEEQSLEEIASQLFTRLVLAGGSRGGNDSSPFRDDGRGGYLGRKLASEFRRLGILEGATASENLFVRYPVRARFPVRGTNPVLHTPDFYQENGRRYVMEQVDFSVQTLARARDRAMYSQYMLTDVVQGVSQGQSNGQPPLQPIAIVNRIPGQKNLIQEYALAALASVPLIEMVYWDRDEERSRFLEERRVVAHTSG